MKVWITRHGQTALNKQQLMQGVYDEPLSEVGIEQAKEARRKIGDVKFDAGYCSPLVRAKKTAMIIGNVLAAVNPGITDPLQYNYTVPMLVFASLGVFALLLGLWLKKEDKIKGYGLELPNIKKD